MCLIKYYEIIAIFHTWCQFNPASADINTEAVLSTCIRVPVFPVAIIKPGAESFDNMGGALLDAYRRSNVWVRCKEQLVL